MLEGLCTKKKKGFEGNARDRLFRNPELDKDEMFAHAKTWSYVVVGLFFFL